MMVRGWFNEMANCQHAIVERLERLEKNFQGFKNHHLSHNHTTTTTIIITNI